MSTQQTLTGKEANCGRVRPRTLLRCHQCESLILRRQRFDHEHHIGVASWQQVDRVKSGDSA